MDGFMLFMASFDTELFWQKNALDTFDNFGKEKKEQHFWIDKWSSSFVTASKDDKQWSIMYSATAWEI